MKYTNPLEEDPLLKELLKQLDRIETRRGFAKWKAQFLEQFEMHLEGTNVTKAGQKYHAFAKRLDRLVLLLKELEGLITAGECCVVRCSVKARQNLSELQKQLAGMIEHTEALVPGTLEEETKAGFSKFDMGAVLVRDGFVEYDRLCICNEILLYMRDLTLADVADRQLLEEMDRYWQKVQTFYQIMGTDLGLHGAILKCRQILRAEDDEFFEHEQKQAAADPDQETPSVKSSRSNKSSSSSAGELSRSEEMGNEKRTQQRFEKVEIYGMDLPLRLNFQLDGEDSSVTDLSSCSDYEDWCWELELPEPKPKAKPAAAAPAAAPPPPVKPMEKKKAPPPLPPAKEEEEPDESESSEEEEEEESAGKASMRYQWSGKDYYHGAGVNWRLASKIKKKQNKGSDDDDDDDDSDSD